MKQHMNTCQYIVINIMYITHMICFFEPSAFFLKHLLVGTLRSKDLDKSGYLSENELKGLGVFQTEKLGGGNSSFFSWSPRKLGKMNPI